METGKEFYPELIRNLPEADIDWPGLRGWLLGNESGLVVFFECDKPTQVGEHAHSAQFGIILDGVLELTIEGKLEVYRRGDTYFVPAGARHSGNLSAGFRAIDVFEEADRYKAKSDAPPTPNRSVE